MRKSQSRDRGTGKRGGLAGKPGNERVQQGGKYLVRDEGDMEGDGYWESDAVMSLLTMLFRELLCLEQLGYGTVVWLGWGGGRPCASPGGGRRRCVCNTSM